MPRSARLQVRHPSSVAVHVEALETRLPPGTLLALPFADLGLGLLGAATAQTMPPPHFNYFNRVGGDRHTTLDATSRLLPVDSERSGTQQFLAGQPTGPEAWVTVMAFLGEPEWFGLDAHPFADGAGRGLRARNGADAEGEAGTRGGMSRVEMDLAILERGVFALGSFGSSHGAEPGSVAPRFAVQEAWLEQALVVTINSRFAAVSSAGIVPPGGGASGPGTASPSDCAQPPEAEICDDDTCPPKSRGVGGIGSGLGGTPGIAPGLGNPNTFQRNFSDARVRYGNGTIWINNPYIPGPGPGGPKGPVGPGGPGGPGEGFGTPWFVTGYWTNISCVGVAGGTPGFGQAELPYLRQVNGGSDAAIYAISNGLNVRQFSGPNGSGDLKTYQTGSFYLHQQEVFQHDTSSNKEFILTTTTGTQWRFHDFDVPSLTQRGELKGFRDAYGNDITTNYAGTVLTVQRGDHPPAAGRTEQFVYTYNGSGSLTNIVLRRSTGGTSWATVRQADFAYYGISDPYGTNGSLKKVEIKDQSSSVLDTYYFRYFIANGLDGDSREGYQGGLKFVVRPESYARLKAQYASPESATDTQVAVYADMGIQYYRDGSSPDYKSRKVKSVTVQGQGCSACSGGQGTLQYDYTLSNNPNDLNKWQYRTKETLPDGNENIVYSNYAGQVMLKDFGVAGGSGDRWVHFWKYGNNDYDKAQVVLHAYPSAIEKVAGKYYDDTKADLLDLDGGNYRYLANSAGRIEVATFFADPTTATETVAGDVKGYLKDTRLKKGELGTEVVQSRTKYFQLIANGPAFGGLKIYPVAQQTLYRDATSNPDSGGSPQTTTYTYTWVPDGSFKKPALDILKVTYPSVSAAQNGPAASEEQFTKFSTYGWPVWSKDGDGYLNYLEYDPATGAVVRSIADATYPNAAAGYTHNSPWDSPTGTRLDLVTKLEVDTLGRTTKLTDPKGNCSYAVFLDTNHEVRIYPGWQTTPASPCDNPSGTSGTTTGPIQVWREDRTLSTSYVETLTISRASVAASGGRPSAPSDEISTSTLQTLTRTRTSPGGQVIEVHAYHNLTGLVYSSQYTILRDGLGQDAQVNVHYYKTVYGYDSRGRQNRVQLPTGTVNRTVYDGLNRPLRVWVGTDEGTTWSETVPGNLKIVARNVYDSTDTVGDVGAVGDGNLTHQVAYPTPKALPADPEPTDRRVTRHWYDWRNRHVASKQGVQATEADDNRPLIASTLNNLGQVVMREQYDGDTLTSPPAPTSNDCYIGRNWLSESNIARRRACVNTDYDDRGRVFRTRTFYVYQETETDSGRSPARAPLQSDTWYGLRGQVLKTAAPGGLVQKWQYDGAGRTLKQFASDGGGDTTYDHAKDVVGDYVLEQVETQYDANSLLQLATRRRRFHDETATGELANKDTAPKARVSYVGNFYDKANRSTAVVDVGTNGGAPYSWDFTTVPARGDNVLVTSYQYHAAGWLELATDPRALVRKTTYDNLGRATRVVEHFTDGTPRTTDNRTTDFTYDGSGHVLTRTAVLPAGAVQRTQYVYTTSAVGGSDIESNDLLVKVGHPHKGNGLPDLDDVTLTETFYYNGVGQQKKSRLDRNETTHTYAFDVVGRLLADTATLGPSSAVDYAVRRLEKAYDSAGRPFLFTSLDQFGVVVNEVRHAFNGFGQLVTEYQEHGGAVNTGTSPKVQYAYSYDPSAASGPNHSRPAGFTYPVSTPYPSGRAFTYAYNADTDVPTWAGIDNRISRPSAIKEGATTLEGFVYLGLSTVVERTHPQPNVNLTYIHPAGGSGSAGDKYIGLDRFDRIVDVHWRNPSTSITTDQFGYGYDRNGNRRYRDNLHPHAAAAAFDELYHRSGIVDTWNMQGQLVTLGYDGFNQLLAFSRGTLNEAKDAIATPTHYQKWTDASNNSTLDALGNWTSVNTNGTTQTRSHNAQNQITAISSPDVPPSYDNNGNTTKDEKGRGLVYDAWDRLVEIKTSPTGTRIVRHSYDALGRRVKDEGGTTKDFYYSKDWQVVEERHDSAVKAHYVWSPVYVDAMVLRDRNNDASTDLEERLYVQHDGNYNVTAVVSAAGVVTERFVYDPYGTPTFLSAVWVPLTGGGLVAWQYLHQGGRYHDFGDGTGLYHFHSRELSPSLGRWVQMGSNDANVGVNSSYSYLGNAPVVWLGSVRFVAQKHAGADTICSKENTKEGEQREMKVKTDACGNTFTWICHGGIFMTGKWKFSEKYKNKYKDFDFTKTDIGKCVYPYGANFLIYHLDKEECITGLRWINAGGKDFKWAHVLSEFMGEACTKYSGGSPEKCYQIVLQILKQNAEKALADSNEEKEKKCARCYEWFPQQKKYGDLLILFPIEEKK